MADRWVGRRAASARPAHSFARDVGSHVGVLPGVFQPLVGEPAQRMEDGASRAVLSSGATSTDDHKSSSRRRIDAARDLYEARSTATPVDARCVVRAAGSAEPAPGSSRFRARRPETRRLRREKATARGQDAFPVICNCARRAKLKQSWRFSQPHKAIRSHMQASETADFSDSSRFRQKRAVSLALHCLFSCSRLILLPKTVGVDTPVAFSRH